MAPDVRLKRWVDYSGEYDFHRWKSNLTTDWSLGDFSASWGMRYVSAVQDACLSRPRGLECSLPNVIRPGFTSLGANRLGSLTYHDFNVGYNTSWKGRILLGVNNAFNKKPRFTLDGASSATTIDADLPLERFFYVRYNQSF